MNLISKTTEIITTFNCSWKSNVLRCISHLLVEEHFILFNPEGAISISNAFFLVESIQIGFIILMKKRVYFF